MKPKYSTIDATQNSRVQLQMYSKEVWTTSILCHGVHPESANTG